MDPGPIILKALFNDVANWVLRILLKIWILFESDFFIFSISSIVTLSTCNNLYYDIDSYKDCALLHLSGVTKFIWAIAHVIIGNPYARTVKIS